MQRLRGIDLRLSSLPQDLQLCADDAPRIFQAANAAQLRLLYAKECREEGWLGTWAEIAFTVSRTSPYFTTPREIARLEQVTVCNHPVPIQNQFYEYLRFGNGRLPKTQGLPRCNQLQVYSRNFVPTFVDLSSPSQSIVVYLTNPADAGRRVFLQGTDASNSTIYSLDGFSRVQGVYVVLTQPFITSPFTFHTLTGIQKDITLGDVQIFQMDPTTGAQVLLLTMAPSETTGWYRRYYLDSLPLNCCNNSGPATTVQVTAMAKLDFIPLTADTDYCLIQNQEAIIEEAQSWRYSKIDTQEAKKMAQEKHIQAIRLLMGELVHFVGLDEPAINFKPFGSATLQRKGIGNLI